MMTLSVSAVVISVLAALFVVATAFMMLVILIQKPKGGGLSGAFGGGGGSENAAFGAKAGDFLTLVTVISFVLFISFAVGLNLLINKEQDDLKSEMNAPEAIPTLPGEQQEAPITTEGSAPKAAETTKAPEAAKTSEPAAPAAPAEGTTPAAPKQ